MHPTTQAQPAAECTETDNLLDPAVYSYENIARALRDTPGLRQSVLKVNQQGVPLDTDGELQQLYPVGIVLACSPMLPPTTCGER